MRQDRFEEFLREAAPAYHEPPETPKGELWQGIERAIGGSNGQWARRRGRRATWIKWSVGLAAALVMGIGIGRMAPRTEQALDSAATSGVQRPHEPATAFRVAATEHLTQVETFLTIFRAEARAGRADDATVRPAQDLLFTTQLLLDSPAAEDVQYRMLLEDIELVLAQIAQYSRGQPEDELEFIDRSIEQRGVLLKLQATVLAGRQGVL